MEYLSVIVNPLSGGVDKKSTIARLTERLAEKGYRAEVLYTEAPGHAIELTQNILKNAPEKLVVVGGDGSVNEVSQALIGSNTALGIIPTGSGNGLARHLGIPLEIEAAISCITHGKIEPIDTVIINNRAFLGVAGIGFDAEVGWAFARAGKRGFLTYLRTAFKLFFNYHCSQYHLKVDGKSLVRHAFLIAFANSSEFGNGASICPQAKINDGLLDLVVIHKFPFYASLSLLFRLFRRSLHLSKYVETIRCKEVEIAGPNLKAHIDGEPLFYPDGMHIRVFPSSLKVCC